MRFEGPIDIRPLTVRGTFGIAWRLLRRNFGAAFFYALIMQLILLFGAAVAVSPVLGSLIKGDYESADFVIGIVVAVLLFLALMLAVFLLYQPIYSGVVYGEMSARVYGHGASLGNLFRRSKYALKRFFTTYLCLVVCGIVVSIAQSILSGLFGGIFSFAGTAAALPAIFSGGLMERAWNGSFADPLRLISSFGAGLAGFFLFTMILQFGVQLCGQSFLCFTYPVAVNESAFNFDAVGRSLKLASKRFGRILGVKALFLLIVLCGELALGALMLPGILLLIDSASAASVTAGIVISAVLAIAATCATIVCTLYVPALDTVLYYDARVRLEGDAWLRMEKPEARSGPEAYPAGQAHYDEAAQTNQNDAWRGGQDGAPGNENNGGEYGA